MRADPPTASLPPCHATRRSHRHELQRYYVAGRLCPPFTPGAASSSRPTRTPIYKDQAPPPCLHFPHSVELSVPLFSLPRSHLQAPAPLRFLPISFVAVVSDPSPNIPVQVATPVDDRRAISTPPPPPASHGEPRASLHCKMEHCATPLARGAATMASVPWPAQLMSGHLTREEVAQAARPGQGLGRLGGPLVADLWAAFGPSAGFVSFKFLNSFKSQKSAQCSKICRKFHKDLTNLR
jgi:hypothetical protein